MNFILTEQREYYVGMLVTITSRIIILYYFGDHVSSHNYITISNRNQFF